MFVWFAEKIDWFFIEKEIKEQKVRYLAFFEPE